MADQAKENPDVTYLMVKAGPTLEPGKVACWEVNLDHPHAEDEDTGEIFIPAKDNAPVRVAKTALVSQKLLRGELVEVNQTSAKTEPAPAPEAAPAQTPAKSDKPAT